MYTPQEQAANAIKWIDDLPHYKQAPLGDRSMLGDAKHGYCCLGAGCVITGTEFSRKAGVSNEFQKKVGLLTETGAFEWPLSQQFWGMCSLACINDSTSAGFKRIAKLMREHPDWMFSPEVATLIKQHYEQTK